MSYEFRKTFILPLTLFFTIMSFCVHGDWIVLNDTTYQNVYIREGRTVYFVHFPETGEIRNIPRSSIAETDIGISGEEDREALLAKWRENNPDRKRSAVNREEVRQHLIKFQDHVETPSVQAAPQTTSSDIQSRAFTLGSDTLPKIVLQTPPVNVAVPMPSRTQNAALAPSSMQRMPIQTAQRPNMGVAGGGMRMPSYGQPGMGGGFGRDVTVITNISDLFFTVDDRMVGETPPEFLPAYMGLR
jgi:hypothetical protein